MAEILLFHPALGLRPGVIAAADRLLAAGHTVHPPDHYDGEAFDDPDDGLQKRDALGYAEIWRRARGPRPTSPPGWSSPVSRSGSCPPSSWPPPVRAPRGP